MRLLSFEATVISNNHRIPYLAADELEVSLLSMQVILPDGFLDQEVKTHDYISANRISSTLGINKEWVVARVKLYRDMHGYENPCNSCKNL